MTKKSQPAKPKVLSDLAKILHAEMARHPDRLEYHTRILGGEITDDGIRRLDEAYQELEKTGFVERSGAVVSYFGTPKSVFRLTEKGRQSAAETAA